MAACRFKVVGIAAEPNVRGQEMRRVRLMAIDSEPFQAAPSSAKNPAPQPTPCSPDGSISILVNPIFAKQFSIGEVFALEERS